MRIFADKDNRRIIVEVQDKDTGRTHQEELTFTAAYKQKLSFDAALTELADEVLNG